MSVPVGCPVLDGTTAVVPLRVAPEHLDRLVDAVGLSPSVTGLIVTVPHTFAAYAHCATATERAHRLRRRRAAGPCGQGRRRQRHPMGTRPEDPLPLPVELLSPSTSVGDVVTHPAAPR